MNDRRLLFIVLLIITMVGGSGCAALAGQHHNSYGGFTIPVGNPPEHFDEAMESLYGKNYVKNLCIIDWHYFSVPFVYKAPPATIDALLTKLRSDPGVLALKFMTPYTKREFAVKLPHASKLFTLASSRVELRLMHGAQPRFSWYRNKVIGAGNFALELKIKHVADGERIDKVLNRSGLVPHAYDFDEMPNQNGLDWCKPRPK